MAKKAFTKGDAATLIGSWDNKGSVSVRDVVVYSCGAKQMVLTDAKSGEEIGRHFAPVVGSLDNVGSYNWKGTFPRMDAAAADAVALEVAALILKTRREEIAARAARDPWAAGRAPEWLAELHEPRVVRPY